MTPAARLILGSNSGPTGHYFRPAWRAAREGADETGPAFAALAAELESLAAEPVGGGLEVPAWIRRLEREVHQMRRPVKAEPKPVPRLEDLRRQLTGDWADREAM